MGRLYGSRQEVKNTTQKTLLMKAQQNRHWLPKTWLNHQRTTNGEKNPI